MSSYTIGVGSPTPHQVPSFDGTNPNICKDITRAGRVRGASLPTEVMLALFIKNIENKHSSWREEIPITEWNGVTCNGQGEVIEISWEHRELKGTLDWKFLPSSIKCVNINNNSLEGDFDLDQLPLSLEYVDIRGNLFSGELNLTKLPPNLYHFDASYNQFVGEVDLTQLPLTMEKLYICYNQFAGKVDLRTLPKGLCYSIVGNQFSTIIKKED